MKTVTREDTIELRKKFRQIYRNGRTTRIHIAIHNRQDDDENNPRV